MTANLVEAQKYMSLYGLSTFYILGTIGNILLICICLQSTHRKNSCSLYLLSATIVNFILIQCILPLAIYSANYPDPQNSLLIWCKIRSYLFNGLLMLYRWFKMAACVDRAAMCSRHVKIRSFSDPIMARRVILGITIIWLLIPIHLAVYFRIVSGRCIPEPGIYAQFFSAYSIIISGWSPPIVMLIFGTIAYVNLKHIRTRTIPKNAIASISDVAANSERYQRINKLDQQLLVSLICEVILYISTNALYSINITYSAATIGISKSTERLQIESFISYLSTPFLIIINNCAPFYLYCLVSSKFRDDVRQLFHCQSANHRLSTNQTTTVPRLTVVNPSEIINGS